jgi:hypothetical protein
MNWGLRITIVYIGFVILIVSLVYISATHKSDLVAKDYYAQELAYQDKIDARINERGLKESIRYQVNDKDILFVFPPSVFRTKFSGEVYFFRASDASKDLTVPMLFNKEGKLLIAKSKLEKGTYKMCLSWKNNAVHYYREEVITI